ncbi:hypothetical protein Tco_1474869 [Tanacetum coccineum]
MANIRTCNKHNMIACVEKTAQNADFYQIIDFLTGCSINYSLLVDPDLIGPWLQQFWATASLQVINDVPHIRAKVAGKKILISEATIRADLLFDDENGVDCFPKQVIWDTLRDIGYEGNLAHLTFSKPLFSPQWKYLVHVLLHCLSPKSTSWEQFGTNIASALVVRGVDRPQIYTHRSLPSKVFYIHEDSIVLKCSGKDLLTFGTPSMLEVVTALAAEEEHSTSPHSKAASSARDARGSPTQSAAHSQRTASVQRTADFQGTVEPHDAASIPKSPNDYTPTDGLDVWRDEDFRLYMLLETGSPSSTHSSNAILESEEKERDDVGRRKEMQEKVSHGAFLLVSSSLRLRVRLTPLGKRRRKEVLLGFSSGPSSDNTARGWVIVVKSLIAFSNSHFASEVNPSRSRAV